MPSHLKNNGRVNLKIDDVVILDVGKRINEEQAELKQYNPFNKDIEENIVETTTKTYKIVGIIERPATNIENYEAPGYTFITYLDKEINKITKCIEQINRRNYKLELDDMSEDELSILKNEVYKTTIMLKESAENSNKEKLELKDSLSDISHQLKTPITSILIILDNLIEDPEMDKYTREDFIRDIKREINSINFLVQSILILSKLDTNTINFIEEEVELKKLVNYAIKNVSILSDLKNVNVNLRVESNSVIKCDFKWQVEAISNILKNCIEHSNDNSDVVVTIEDNKVYSKITIKDNGGGIDKDDLPHIFERFYKGKNSTENSVGIGLSLSKNIIEKNNGIILCKSEIGKGTEFIIKYMKKMV